jgi:hypothetical protein
MTSHKSRYERHADYRRAFRIACEEHPELLIATCLSFTSKIGPKSCIKTLNLPPHLTCRRTDLVIASPICRACCYCHKMREWPSVEPRAENNFRMTKLAAFANILTWVILQGQRA